MSIKNLFIEVATIAGFCIIFNYSIYDLIEWMKYSLFAVMVVAVLAFILTALLIVWCCATYDQWRSDKKRKAYEDSLEGNNDLE